MDHITSFAARDLRTRLEQQPAALPFLSGDPDDPASDRALVIRSLVAFEDLMDRVTVLERAQRRAEKIEKSFRDRLEFLGHVSRMLGGIEDWTVPVPDPDEPGEGVTAVQAPSNGTSGPASSATSSPASVPA
jgi:hypothetical protein